MSIPTFAEICDAIDTTIGEALVTSRDMTRSENYDELSEGGIQDENVLQIYPQSLDPVSSGSETHKLTLAGPDSGVIRESVTVHIDYYARQRSHLGDDMSVLVAGIQAIRAKLKEQDCPTPFGLSSVGSFQWRGERVTFDYGGALYAGWRWVLVLEVF